MKRYTFLIPPHVEEQITDQVLYIARDSVDNAFAWEDRLRTAIEHIGDVPYGHAVDAEASSRFGDEVRKVVFERTYLLFYRINESERVVEILNFRHGARLPRGYEP